MGFKTSSSMTWILALAVLQCAANGCAEFRYPPPPPPPPPSRVIGHNDDLSFVRRPEFVYVLAGTDLIRMTTDDRHRELVFHSVHRVEFSPNGREIAVSSSNSVEIIEAQTLAQHRRIWQGRLGSHQLGWDATGRSILIEKQDPPGTLWLDAHSGRSVPPGVPGKYIAANHCAGRIGLDRMSEPCLGVDVVEVAADGENRRRRLIRGDGCRGANLTSCSLGRMFWIDDCQAVVLDCTRGIFVVDRATVRIGYLADGILLPPPAP